MSVPRIQQSFCSTKISTVIKDAVQSLGYKEIRKDQFQNFLNTWCDHEIADSAQPRYRSIVTRPFSLLVHVKAGSGHETTSILNTQFNGTRSVQQMHPFNIYRIAGNFHGCKLSRKRHQKLQKKLSWFLLSRLASVWKPHPHSYRRGARQPVGVIASLCRPFKQSRFLLSR